MAEGDTVAVRWRVTGKHDDALKLGPIHVPKSGRAVKVRGFSMCRIRDAQIVEIWQIADLMEAFRQMGAELTPARSADG